MSERTYWDYEQACWVPSPEPADANPSVPPQRAALADAEEADVRSG
jgi:hypothetical protein